MHIGEKCSTRYSWRILSVGAGNAFYMDGEHSAEEGKTSNIPNRNTKSGSQNLLSIVDHL